VGCLSWTSAPPSGPQSAEEGQPDCQVHSMMQACQDYKRLIGEE
jgi:hypothetical protein